MRKVSSEKILRISMSVVNVNRQGASEGLGLAVVATVSKATQNRPQSDRSASIPISDLSLYLA
jgi:hypothetical protein